MKFLASPRCALTVSLGLAVALQPSCAQFKQTSKIKADTAQNDGCNIAAGILSALPSPLAGAFGGVLGTLANTAASLVGPNCKGAALATLGQESLNDIAGILTDVSHDTQMQGYSNDLTALGNAFNDYTPFPPGSANDGETRNALSNMTRDSESVYADFNQNDPSYVKNYIIAASLRVLVYQESLRFDIASSVAGGSLSSDRDTLIKKSTKIAKMIDDANDVMNKMKGSVPGTTRSWFSSASSIQQNVTTPTWDPGDANFDANSQPDLTQTETAPYGMCYTSTIDPAKIAAASSTAAPAIAQLRKRDSASPICVYFTIPADGNSVTNVDVAGVSASAIARQNGLDKTLLPAKLEQYNQAIYADLFSDHDVQVFNENMTKVRQSVVAIAQALPNCLDGNCALNAEGVVVGPGSSGDPYGGLPNDGYDDPQG